MNSENNDLPCIAVGQLMATNNKAKNLEIVRKLAARAVCEYKAQVCFFTKILAKFMANNLYVYVQMLFLPEASDYISTNASEMMNLAEPLDGPTVIAYKEIARTNKLWMSVGVHEKVENNNEVLVICFQAHMLSGF